MIRRLRTRLRFVGSLVRTNRAWNLSPQKNQKTEEWCGEALNWQ
jgi:hypothetical protein